VPDAPLHDYGPTITAIRNEDVHMTHSTDKLPALAHIAVVASGLLASATALTEGAVKLLDCTVVQICDAQGQCEAGSGPASFRMEPIQIEAGGVGTYTISYNDIEAEMNAMSEVGPFYWMAGAERNVLIVSSRTDWLWHQLTSDSTPEATVRFLTSCSFQR
jgi:hypothetical protein